MSRHPRAIPTDSLTTDEVLSPGDLYRLTLWKWRYTLEGLGFSPAESARLVFLKWLQATARVAA